MPTRFGSVEQSKSWIVSEVEGASGLTANFAIGFVMVFSFVAAMLPTRIDRTHKRLTRSWGGEAALLRSAEAMDFRLLGPLEVRSQGRALPLGGPKQRAVLALLLLHPGEVVSTDRLVDDLWGERPPKTVDAYIQNCISRLRGVLGRDAIETRSPGYLLRADAADIDAVRFERALDAARNLDVPERAAAL